MDENIGSLLEAVTDQVIARDPHRVAVVQGERERTWADLDQRASALAGHLSAAGVTVGGRVGIGLYNSIEYIESLLAIFKLRATPVNVNYRYQESELEQILRYTDASAVILDSNLRARLLAVASRLESLRALVSAGVDTGEPAQVDGQAVVGFEEAASAAPLPRQRRSSSDQIIILTGGTTGRPKGVVWDHAGVSSVVSSVYRRNGLSVPANRDELLDIARTAMDTGRAPVMLPVSPLMHGTGFFFGLGNLLLGGRIACLVNRSLDPAEVWTAVERHRVREMAIVGDAFGRPLMDELDRAQAAGSPYDIHSLERVVSSGVLWSADVKHRFLEAGRITLQDSIASTEGGPYGISMVGPGGGLVSPRFTLPSNARVIGPDGRDVRPGSGEVGELASSGNLPLEYLDDPERTVKVFRMIEGVRYAVPGDMATVEADGTLTFLGRGSGVINTGGEKVFAEEVEEALLEHPAVAEAVVVGVADERWGSRVTALVRPALGQRPTAMELSTHVGGLLAGYKRPRQIFFLTTIERTVSGKVNRRWAQERARQLAAEVEPRDHL